MPKPLPPRKKQLSKKYKKKEYDFKPSREQMIRGAFYDLGKPVNKKSNEYVAKYIAQQWGEEI